MISQPLLEWYAIHARQLPWRDHPDPYAIWISEIMLQQTRVETVVDYFTNWMQTFPDIVTLANSSEQDVLRQWEGLGYYSRARNIHKTARILQSDFDGQLPADLQTLQKLPGIGRYTAAAITSMAFGMNQAALDGNIRRILSRIFDVSLPIRTPAAEKLFWELAEENLPPGQAGNYNQALMDLGATICLPGKPKCLLCPLQQHCLAFERGVQEQRPVIPEKKPVSHYIVTAAILEHNQHFLLAQRPANGLLGGLWEFPGGKQEENETLPEALQREIMEELGCEISVEAHFGEYQHAYTHFRVTLHAFICSLIKGEPQPIEASQLAWVRAEQLSDYPMGKIDRQIAETLRKNADKSL
jgi:A/G-specific adenine glycosylase